MSFTTPVYIFCLAPAGSSASIYRDWQQKIAAPFKIIALEYPGHGSKIAQPLINDPEILAKLLTAEICHYQRHPFILFGHSVGASLIWRIEQQLKQSRFYQHLLMLIVSSRPAPMYLKQMPQKSILNDKALIQELKLYNNFPEEILNDQATLKFFMPIIRNDFLLSDKMLNDEICTTDKPLLALYGTLDPYLDAEIMEDWHSTTKHWLGAYALDGDHFYFLKPHNLQRSLALICSKAVHLLSESSQF